MEQKTLEQKLRYLYKSSVELQSTFEAMFGKEFFSKPVIDRIDGWEDMMAETGRPDIPEFECLPEDYRPFFKAVYENVVMTEAYNEGKRMDIYDKNTPRHYPYFDTNGSPLAFAFRDSRCGRSFASAGSGSRLSFRDAKTAAHVGKKHTDIIRRMLES